MADQTRLLKQDRRRKADLDLLILALISHGSDTPYLLQRQAGLSSGATVPALSRLEELGLISRGKPGPRRRSAYGLTKTGRKYLDDKWLPLLDEDPPSDLDAVLRLSVLAALLDRTSTRASEYLRKAAESRASDLKRQRDISETARKKLKTDDPGDLYMWMRAFAGASRTRNEAILLRRIADELEEAATK